MVNMKYFGNEKKKQEFPLCFGPLKVIKLTALTNGTLMNIQEHYCVFKNHTRSELLEETLKSC